MSIWGHRNLFGGAETLRLDGQVSCATTMPEFRARRRSVRLQVQRQLRQAGDPDAEGRSRRPGRRVLREVTNAYIREAVTFNAGVRRTFNDQLSASVGVDLETSQVQDSTGDERLQHLRHSDRRRL